MCHITAIEGNSQKLDGGAMFGNVPKALWSKWIAPDEKNRISLACRALLIQDGSKNILLETGIGAFFEPNLRERYGVEETDHILLNSLKKIGLNDNDIDFVILSHLHFDHAGGLLSAWQADQEPRLLFPKARYIVSKINWDRACQPHVRDRASFIPHLNNLLQQSNRLVLQEQKTCTLLGDQYEFIYTHGHTPGLMHTIFKSPQAESIIFASDLIPGIHWVHLPVSMGYDRSPELLIDEKKELLEFAIQHNAYLFYTHDPVITMSKIIRENGKYIAVEKIL